MKFTEREILLFKRTGKIMVEGKKVGRNTNGPLIAYEGSGFNRQLAAKAAQDVGRLQVHE